MQIANCELRIADWLAIPHSAIRIPQFLSAHVRAVALAVACLLAGAADARASDGAASFADVARQVQPKVVKLYGAGGFRGLEAVSERPVDLRRRARAHRVELRARCR